MEKITYHSPSLFDAPGTEALTLRNKSYRDVSQMNPQTLFCAVRFRLIRRQLRSLLYHCDYNPLHCRPPRHVEFISNVGNVFVFREDDFWTSSGQDRSVNLDFMIDYASAKSDRDSVKYNIYTVVGTLKHAWLYVKATVVVYTIFAVLSVSRGNSQASAYLLLKCL